MDVAARRRGGRCCRLHTADAGTIAAADNSHADEHLYRCTGITNNRMDAAADHNPAASSTRTALRDSRRRLASRYRSGAPVGQRWGVLALHRAVSRHPDVPRQNRCPSVLTSPIGVEPRCVHQSDSWMPVADTVADYVRVVTDHAERLSDDHTARSAAHGGVAGDQCRGQREGSATDARTRQGVDDAGHLRGPVRHRP